MFVSGGSGGAPHSREREHCSVGVQVSGELPPQPLQSQVVQG